MYKQTSLKKFVLPVLFDLTSQSKILSSQAEQEDFSRFILRISLKQTFSEAQSMKQGDKSADWFIKKSKKGNLRTLENLVNKTLTTRATIFPLYHQPRSTESRVYRNYWFGHIITK